MPWSRSPSSPRRRGAGGGPVFVGVKESRGGHFRSDYPQAEARLQKRTFVTLDDLHAVEASLLPRARRAALEMSL